MLSAKTATVATPRNSTSRVVFDASAVVRALVEHHPVPIEWLQRVDEGELSLHWPSLVYVEVANTLLKLQRAGRSSRGAAAHVLRGTFRLPARSFAIERLAGTALALAVERRLSVYDASYVVLAEALGASLLTADRRLAAATEHGVLIGG